MISRDLDPLLQQIGTIVTPKATLMERLLSSPTVKYCTLGGGVHTLGIMSVRWVLVI